MKNPGTACSNSVTVPVGSASGTPGNGAVAAPVLTGVMPNPINVGTVTVTLSGSGFVAGALVYDSFGTQSMIQYSASSRDFGRGHSNHLSGLRSYNYILREESGIGLQQFHYSTRQQRTSAAPIDRAHDGFGEPWRNPAVHFIGSNYFRRDSRIHNIRRPLHRPGHNAVIKKRHCICHRTRRNSLGQRDTRQSRSAGDRPGDGNAQPGRDPAVHFNRWNRMGRRERNDHFDRSLYSAIRLASLGF